MSHYMLIALGVSLVFSVGFVVGAAWAGLRRENDDDV